MSEADENDFRPSPVKEQVQLDQVWLERATSWRYVVRFVSQHLDGFGPVLVALLCVETGRAVHVDVNALLGGKWERL